jgi:hypothetical protein
MGFHIANGFGVSVDAPTVEQMRVFLDELDINDEEHGAAWLSTDDGVSLEWSGDGRLVFDDGALHEGRFRHLAGVLREHAVTLWAALARGDRVEGQPWAPGNGFVRTPEREARLRDAQAKMERDFYDNLGGERATARSPPEVAPTSPRAHVSTPAIRASRSRRVLDWTRGSSAPVSRHSKEAPSLCRNRPPGASAGGCADYVDLPEDT